MTSLQAGIPLRRSRAYLDIGVSPQADQLDEITAGLSRTIRPHQ